MGGNLLRDSIMKYIIYDTIEEYEILISEINSRRKIIDGTYSYPIVGTNCIAMRIEDDEILLLPTKYRNQVVNELAQDFWGETNETN